ncbi:MAG TPA: hypothetical protein VEB19_12885 [Gemmatimonadaceae bacterium]|nr:hypothetical protein [Gemmatimonadaceae bacterium]
MEVALSVIMRRVALRIDQAPAWAFVAAAIVAFGLARAGRLYGLLHQSRGGVELGGILTLTVFLAVLIFAVRRRQCTAWQSTSHVMGSMVVGNSVALVLVWPFIPDGVEVAMAPLLRDTLWSGALMAAVTLPLGIAMLWLSRRYGSHSGLTERRTRVVHEILRRRFARTQPDEGAADAVRSSGNPASRHSFLPP